MTLRCAPILLAILGLGVIQSGCGGSASTTTSGSVTTITRQTQNKKNPLNRATKCGAVPPSTEGETELRGVVFEALLLKLGDVVNDKPELVAQDLGLVQAFCANHAAATLGQATKKALGASLRP